MGWRAAGASGKTMKEGSSGCGNDVGSGGGDNDQEGERQWMGR